MTRPSTGLFGRRSVNLAMTILGSLLLALLSGACSDEKTTNANEVSGTITAKSQGIIGQNGNAYAVGVFNYDWSPGATIVNLGALRLLVDADPFSSELEVLGADANGAPTTEVRTFAPGDYSVVFFISPPGSPPQYFAEVRAHVNGDIVVTAPAWGQWTH